MSEHKNEEKQHTSLHEMPDHIVSFMSDVAEIIEQVGNRHTSMLKGYEALLKLYAAHDVKS